MHIATNGTTRPFVNDQPDVYETSDRSGTNSAATHAALVDELHAFRRGTNIACGSSIAPAGAQLSGTLGALLIDVDKNVFALSNMLACDVMGATV